MNQSARCSALVADHICTNGFASAPACRHTDFMVPPCMSEKWSARMFPETGGPAADDVKRARERAAQWNG